MRIKHKVNVRIGYEAAMTNLLFAPDDTAAEVVIDGYVRHTSGQFSIAANTNEDLALGDITAVKGIYLVVDQDCVVTLNGGTDTIQMRVANSTTGSTAKLFIECDLSEINVAAPVTLATTGYYVVWGDAS